MKIPETVPSEVELATGENGSSALVPPKASTRTDAFVHGMMLSVACLVVALSCLLSVENSTSVVIPGLNQPLPELCTFRRTLGIDCPGCGLTRCFISLGHGDVMSAWYFNPAGILLFGIVLFQIPYRIMQLWLIRTTGVPIKLPDRVLWILMTFSILLIIQWIVRTALGF